MVHLAGHLCFVLQKQFTAFKAEVMNPVNKNKLFVMIVDEAHQATVRRGAHDAFVNDLMWKTSAGSTAKHGPFPKAALQPSEQPGGLCDQPNLLTLLVSATPACLLTADSRIPRRYYVPKGSESTPLAQSLGLQPYSIIRTNDQRIGHGGMAKLRDMSWIWLKDGGQQSLDATTLQSLVERKVLHCIMLVAAVSVPTEVISWSWWHCGCIAMGEACSSLSYFHLVSAVMCGALVCVSCSLQMQPRKSAQI